MINGSILLIVASLFYSLALIILFFSKQHIDSKENKIFSILVITNFIGLILEMTNYFSVSYMTVYPIFNQIISKLYLLYLLTWISVFTVYTFIISYSKINQLQKRSFIRGLLTSGIILYLLSALLMFSLPLEYVNNSGSVYSYGMGANVVYIYSGICIAICIGCMLLNIKNVKNKKYLPLFLFIGIGILTILIQKSYPSLLLFTSMETFVTMIMYFTIENPDVKMLNEFIRNKEHADKVNNEKTMFLYRISQNLKHPVASIANSCDRILKDGKFDEFTKEEIIDITLNVKKMTESVNSVLNISDVETKDIKITNKQYKPQELFDQLIQKMKVNLKDKEIELRVELDDSIPKQLMGDNIRLKQVINTVIENSLKYTEKGFIEFSVSPIIKHEICSLMITVEDSGCGINRDKLYHLFEDADKFDEGKQNLITAKKIVDLNGGTITIDSHEGRGTKVTLIVNQKLVETEQDKILRTVEKHPNNKSILLIENNKDEQDKFIKLLKKYDVNIDIVNMGQFGLEKIRQENHYDLILLAEEMPKLSGIQTFQKLKEIKNFNTPVILLIDEKHHELVKRYLAIGFEKVLIRPVKKDEIANLINELQN